MNETLSQDYWLKSVPFDLTLILAVAALALATGLICVLNPNYFIPILLIDIWFLGSPHVIATFSRISFDKESFQQYKFLVIWLPLIIVMCTVSLGLIIGPWLIATTYLYWQWFHYTRQSYGIARIYQLKANPQAKGIDFGVIYGLPLLGILYRSYQAPSTFLGLELKVLPVAEPVLYIAGIYAFGSLALWLRSQYQEYKDGTFSQPCFLFICTHIVIFLTGYILIENINFGWLVLNVWHNAQYILFVWMFHNRRFKNEYDSKKRLLSLLSLNANHWLFYGFCLAISFAFYTGLYKLINVASIASIPALSVAVLQTTNFHHYIVDGIIWRVRKKPVSDNLGISH